MTNSSHCRVGQLCVAPNAFLRQTGVNLGRQLTLRRLFIWWGCHAARAVVQSTPFEHCICSVAKDHLFHFVLLVLWNNPFLSPPLHAKQQNRAPATIERRMRTSINDMDMCTHMAETGSAATKTHRPKVLSR